MKNQLKHSNYYISTIDAGSSIDNLSDTGSFLVTDKTVDNVSIADWEYIFFLTVNFPESTKREIFRIWKVDWYRLYFDKRISPNWKQSHVWWTVIQINDVSEALWYLSENTDNVWFVEHVSDLDVKVFWWLIQVWNTSYTISTQTVSVFDNDTSYVIYNFDLDQLSVVNDLTWLSYYLFAEVVASGWDVSTITDKRPVFIWFDINDAKPVFSIGSVTTLDPGSSATVSMTWTDLSPILNFWIPKGSTWDIWVPGVDWQNVEEIQTLPAWATVEIVWNTIVITLSSWVYTIYSELWIWTYSADDELMTWQDRTWVFDTPIMTYSDWMEVNWITWAVSFTGKIAYLNQNNVFEASNTFQSDTTFEWRTSFRYYTQSTASNTLTFDARNWMKQAIEITWAGSKTLTFDYLLPGATYTLAVINHSGSSITFTKWNNPTNSDTVVSHYKIGSQVYPITMLNNEVHIFVFEAFSTAIHWSYVGSTSWSF